MRVFEKSKHPETLTTQQEEVLTGLMLGDGHLRRWKAYNANASLIVGRAAKDRAYNAWIAGVFANMLPPNGGLTDRIQCGKTSDTIRYQSNFRSKSCVVLNQYHSIWYGDTVKHLPPDLALTPLSIAVWLCDDGHVGFKKGNVVSNFATNCFSRAEVERLVALLNARYQFPFRIVKLSGKKSGQYLIDGSNGATRSMLEEIKDHFPGGMERKMIWTAPEFVQQSLSECSPSLNLLTKSRTLLFARAIASLDEFTVAQICETLGWYRDTPSEAHVVPSCIKACYLPQMLDIGAIELIGVVPGSRARIYRKTENGMTVLNALEAKLAL